eukprot:sb/3465082/
MSSKYFYEELGFTAEQELVSQRVSYSWVASWWSASIIVSDFSRNSDGTFEFETMDFIDSSTLRLVGKNRKSSLFKGLLLINYNLIYDPKEEITEHRQEFNADTLVCAKNISETFLLEVCQRLKFDNSVMSTTAGEYGVSNTALDHYDWGIGSVHYKRTAHFEIGSGGCTEKADALVLECGFDKEPQSFKLHIINVYDVVPAIDPLDWKAPAYSDPSSGYVVATLNFIDDSSMSGLVCAESLTKEILLGICHEMGFHTLISNFSRYTESNALVNDFSFDPYYKTLTDSTMGDCPERRVVWLECGFDVSLCEDIVLNGYLVSKCSHPTKTDEQNTFKCPNSTQVYRVTPDKSRPCDLSFSSLCQDDHAFYQVCAYKPTECVANNLVKQEVVCGDFICQTEDDAISNNTVIVSGSIVKG